MNPRPHSRAPDGPRRGTTLLELLVGLATLASLLLVVLGVEGSAERSLRANERASEPVENTARLADRIDRELRMAGFLTLRVPGALGLEAPVDGQTYEELHFKRATGFTTAGVVYGPELTLRRVLDPGEVANGSDDDGDGLADEGMVLLETLGGLSATIATRVTAFSIQLVNHSLVVTVGTGVGGPGGHAVTQSVVRTVTLRNN